jgi:hypothetical protein
MMKAKNTKKIGVTAQTMMNSAGFIFRSARARSTLMRVAMSWRSITRDRPATTADSCSPFPSAPSTRPAA